MTWPLWEEAKADVEEIRAAVCSECWEPNPEACFRCFKLEAELDKLWEKTLGGTES